MNFRVKFADNKKRQLTISKIFDLHIHKRKSNENTTKEKHSSMPSCSSCLFLTKYWLDIALIWWEEVFRMARIIQTLLAFMQTAKALVKQMYTSEPLMPHIMHSCSKTGILELKGKKKIYSADQFRSPQEWPGSKLLAKVFARLLL